MGAVPDTGVYETRRAGCMLDDTPCDPRAGLPESPFMASPSLPSLPDDLGNSGSVAADEDFAAIFGESDPKAIRRAHLRDESYLKAVGKVNYLYAVLFVAYDACFLYWTVRHLSGKSIAPWSVRPGWLALQANFGIMAVLSLLAGYGFRRLKPWSMPVEALFVLCFLIQWPLSIIAYSKPPSLGYFAGGVLLLAAFLVPLINLWDVRGSLVLTPGYGRVVATTPGVRVKAKLSWELKLMMLVLFVVATTILVFTVEP